jgi:hypothetical protein
MENRFDELSKALTGGISRREAFRRAGGLLVGAVLASLGLERFASAAGVNCSQVCTRTSAEDICMKTDCADKTPSDLPACLATCIPIVRRNCRVDCNTCQRRCTNTDGTLDVVCYDDCFANCRNDCEALHYPPAQLDSCVVVCAKCIKSHRPLCGDGRHHPPFAAHCCRVPAEVCIKGRCKPVPCPPPPWTPCYFPDGTFGGCCRPGSACCSGRCCHLDQDCVQGKCVDACRPSCDTGGGQKCCNTPGGLTCVDSRDDRNNCGYCGITCDDTQVCAQGHCDAGCLPDALICTHPGFDPLCCNPSRGGICETVANCQCCSHTFAPGDTERWCCPRSAPGVTYSCGLNRFGRPDCLVS